MESFLRGSALRRWLAGADNSDAIKFVSELLAKAFPPAKGLYRENSFTSSSTNAMEIDVDELDSSGLSDILTARLHAASRRRSATTRLYKRLQINGIIYSSCATHKGNSLIQYHLSKTSRKPVVGEIEHIISDDGTIYLAVRQHLPLSSDIDDPFIQYTDFPARIYSSALAKETDLINAEQIVSHVARFVVPGTSTAVIVSLNRY